MSKQTLTLTKDSPEPNAEVGQYTPPTTSETDKGYEERRGLEFCAEVTVDTANCLELMADTPTHLPADSITDAGDRLERSTKTSPTNVGLYLASLVAMRDMNIIEANKAQLKVGEILTTLDQLEKHQGLFFNWYDVNSGDTVAPRGDKLISTVDNAWLAVGLITIKNAGFGPDSERAGKLLDDMDLMTLYDEKEGLFYGHYDASNDEFSNYHNDVMLSETRIASYIAMSKNNLPIEHFYHLGRHTPAGRPTVKYDKTEGAKSWGGSMFEALMPKMVADEEQLEDIHFAQIEQIRGQIEYGQEELDGRWGVSVCQTPEDGYQELGVPDNSMGEGYPATTVITPHAKFLALPFARQLVIDGLIKDRQDFPDCYNENLGFCDSIDTSNGKVSKKFLSLDQAMILLPLYNDWLRDVGGLHRYTGELMQWRNRQNQEIGHSIVEAAQAA